MTGSIKRFRRTPWRFQATFSTPLRKLGDFSSTILSSLGDVREGILVIDSVVFEPRHLIDLLQRNGLAGEVARDRSITAVGPRELGELLEAALGDWVDFALVPSPKPFVLYADHDEFTTFFANTKSNLNGVVQPLAARGFREVVGFAREF
ncbi:MAG: hypothetical protein JNL10_10465 [Verrucomicrobiales bacterium]|nr:hypothetical protein [Verrucomicrobiales bacterium]